jgi:S1-C subfamily serine protease
MLTRSGEVLTNNHVIRGASDIRVVVPSTGRRYVAKVLGYSVKSDIALLQLQDAPSVRTVTIGDSAKVRVGQRVTALGNAGGVGGPPSSSSGKVTGLNRSIDVSDTRGLSARLTGLIRIDASLEPGDSGGPLLDSAGRVIGIDTAASVGFEFQSAHEGFAIPINRALAIARAIRTGTTSVAVHVGPTPFLGLSVGPPSSSELGGAMVFGVARGSPADRAGIVPGDRIVALDNRRIGSYDALTDRLLRRTAGDPVRVSWVDEDGTAHTAGIRTIAGPPQ